MILEGFGDDFGELLGEVWSLLAHLRLIFGCLYDACILNACSKASRTRLGSPTHENKHARMHFRLKISSVETVVLRNWFLTLSVCGSDWDRFGGFLRCHESFIYCSYTLAKVRACLYTKECILIPYHVFYIE